jgi:hypothetical protein
MYYQVSQTIRDAVQSRVDKAEGNGRYISVYEAAQEIQDNHPTENVALEDIVGALVEAASLKSIALELSNPPATVSLVLDAAE